MTYRVRTPRRGVLRGLGLAATGALLAGCAGSSTPPPRRFYLRPLQAPPTGLPKVDWSLVIDLPQTLPALQTNRIVLAFAPNEFDYYAEAEWGDLPTVMVQGILIRSFQTSGAIDVVANERQRLRPDFTLHSTLLPFYAQGPQGAAPDAKVGMDLQLVQMRGRETIGTRSIEHTVQAERPEIEAIVAAFDVAMSKVIEDVVRWTLETGQEAAATG
jgi:cholesterol transport system auxiliary component